MYNQVGNKKIFLVSQGQVAGRFNSSFVIIICIITSKPLLHPLLGRRHLKCDGVPILNTLQETVYVVSYGQLLEKGYELQQLPVLHVVEPRDHRHSVFWMEDIGCGRIVNYDYFV